MKGIDIFCASQAAITTMDSSSATAGRAIDRHNPIIQDQKRLTTPPTTHHNKNKKLKNPKTTTTNNNKTSAAFADENTLLDDEQENNNNNKDSNKNDIVVRRQGGVLLGWGCTRPGDFISPANSSRFLLTHHHKALLSDQFDPLLNQPPPVKLHTSDDDHDKSKGYDVNVLSSSPVKTPPRSSSSDQQVVVLRVSLHCRGCEKKMRKHISKMEGVTSFNIDFMAKKVTVVGDVTPLAVLTSVSKVKNAKLLTPTTISAPPASHTGSNISEIKKELGVVA